MVTLEDVMTKKVVVATVSSSIDNVRRLMLQHRVSRIVIVDFYSAPVGMITEKDLLRYTLEEDSTDLDKITAHQVMSRLLVKESDTEPVSSCAKDMLDMRISSVVVVHGDALAGIVTKTDLCMFYAVNGGRTEQVRKRMTARPITVHASLNILDAATIMMYKKISRVPVANNHLDGIVTLSDLTTVNPTLSRAIVMMKDYPPEDRRAVLPSEVGLPTVGDIMTRNPVTVMTDSFLSDAAKSMITHHISGLPVLNSNNVLEGILTKTDVTKAVASMA